MEPSDPSKSQHLASDLSRDSEAQDVQPDRLATTATDSTAPAAPKAANAANPTDSSPAVSGGNTAGDARESVVRQASTSAESTVRRGNPFRPGTESGPPAERSMPADASVPGNTATSATVSAPQPTVANAATWASVTVLPFAVACLAFFPGGGVFVSGLGGLLGLAGLVSRHATVAGLLAAFHLGLGVACYRVMLG